MIPDSLDFIRRGTNDEQAEYAAAQTPAPADAGEADAGAGLPTPVSPSLPQGEAGPPDLTEVIHRLTTRADSYARDAVTLAEMGDDGAVIHRTVAKELRKIADELREVGR